MYIINLVLSHYLHHLFFCWFHWLKTLNVYLVVVRSHICDPWLSSVDWSVRPSAEECKNLNLHHVQDQVGPSRRVISTEHGFWWLSIVKPLEAMLSGNAPNGYRLRLAISNENWFHKTERYECGECDDFCLSFRRLLWWSRWETLLWFFHQILFHFHSDHKSLLSFSSLLSKWMIVVLFTHLSYLVKPYKIYPLDPMIILV